MFRKVILAAVLALVACGESSFEKAAKLYAKEYRNDAAGLFKKSCDEEKNAAACYMAAYAAEQNGYYDTNEKEVFALYEKACELGDMDGCSAVAAAYEGNALGGSVKIDYQKAAALYEKACDSGVGEACARAAAHHEGEYGGEKDAQKVWKYYLLACDYKDAQSCYSLARGYEKGERGEKDAKKAAELYGLACDYGYDMGCVKFRELIKKAE